MTAHDVLTALFGITLGVATGAVIGFISIVVRGVWEVHHEHRQAITHRRDPRPGASAGPLASGAWASRGTDPSPDVAAVGAGTGLEPIRAWKHATPVVMADGSVVFYPTVLGHSLYNVVSFATCDAGRHSPLHRVPDSGCSCGFYAHNHWVDPTYDYATLEVELYGRVIVGETGYRAEKQRVLSITAHPRCVAQWSTSDMHWQFRDQLAVTTMGTVGQLYGPCQNVARWQDAEGTPVCAEHAMTGRSRFWAWRPAPVRCNTEWRWVE